MEIYVTAVQIATAQLQEYLHRTIQIALSY